MISVGENERKRYWSQWRMLAVIVWLSLLFLIPFFLEKFHLIQEGMGFVSFFSLLVMGVGIFLDKLSVRIGIAVVIILAMGSIYRPESLSEVIDDLDFQAQDVFFQIRGPKKPSGQVVIVDIDNKSLEAFGQWPWPRAEIAQVIRTLKEDGARVIGFDIVFAEPDRLSLKDWVSRLRNMGIGVRSPHNAGESTLSEEFKGFNLSSSMVKQIVLKDWEKRLTRMDSTFYVEPGIPDDLYEQRIISGYQSFAKMLWEEEENTNVLRAARAGLVYRPRPYLESQRPLLEMTRASREMFYLTHRLGNRSFLADGGRVIVDNDYELGMAIRDTKAVAGGLFIIENSAGARLSSFRKSEALRETQGMVVSAGIVGANEVFPGMRKALQQVVNVPAIQSMCYHQGTFNITPDQSGTARYYTMLMDAPIFQESLVLKPGKESLDGEALLDPNNYEVKIISHTITYPSIALEMIRAANGYDEVVPGFLNRKRGLFLRRIQGFHYGNAPDLNLGAGKRVQYYSKDIFANILPQERFIPLDFRGDFLINYLGYGGRWQPEYQYGPEYYIPYFSLADVVKKTFTSGSFKDKYVLIGSSDPTLSDLIGSPFRPAFPGMEVHATVLDNLIKGDYLVEYEHWEVLFTFFGILLGGAALVVLIAYARMWVAMLATLVVLVGLPIFSYFALSQGHTAIHFVYPWNCMVLLSAVTVLVNFFVEGRDRRFVVAQFSKMVSPQVLQKLRDDPKSVALGGQRSVVSVLFSDIKGFTTISEALDPKKLVELLNDYFTPMTDIILSHDGFIDKFIGDAIMGCWGVPLADKDHAIKACRAACEQQRVLVGVAKSIKQHYDVDISVRIGIASGEVSAAMMGSESRKSFTVMGDIVNLGARLEPACGDYGVKILMSESTYEFVKDDFETRCVDKLVVKGKTVPAPIYELLGEKGMVSAELLEVVRHYTKALELHWDRQWQAALDALEEAKAVIADDHPSEVLAQRIRSYMETPPPPQWNGAYVKTTK